jgi:hypothetical protein
MKGITFGNRGNPEPGVSAGDDGLPRKRSSATVMIGIETATPAAAKTSARI